MYLILPALVALVLKLIVLANAYKNDQSATLRQLLLVFACHNACEIVIFISLFGVLEANWVIRTYYCISFWAATYMAIYGLKIGRIQRFDSAWKVLILLPIVPSILVFSGDSIVAGSELIGYLYFATKGNHYPIFTIYIFTFYFLMIAALIHGYKNPENYRHKVQCLYAGFSLIPIVLAVAVVMSLQSYGYAINTTVILPLASTFFIWMLAKGEREHGLTDLRKWIPFSSERKAASRIANAESQYFMQEINYREFKERVEKIALERSLEDANGSVTAAAQNMGLNRTTVYSMMNKHEISPSVAKSKK